jgi:hypothetical protein
MRRRSHQRNLVVWSSSAGTADRYGAPGFRRLARTRRIHRWIRTGALLAVIGLMRLPRAVRTRWRPMLLLAAGIPMAAGIVLSSGVTFLSGLAVLLLTLLIPWDSPASFADPALMPFLVDGQAASRRPDGNLDRPPISSFRRDNLRARRWRIRRSRG